MKENSLMRMPLWWKSGYPQMTFFYGQ